jgi:hypothetical protein
MDDVILDLIEENGEVDGTCAPSPALCRCDLTFKAQALVVCITSSPSDYFIAG